MNDRWDDDQETWDEPGDDLDDDSGSDDADDDWNDDDSETVSCASCGAQVYEDAIRCPVCGEYISHSTHWTAGRPWWWVVLGVLGVFAVLGTMLLGIVFGLGQ